ncbi:agmatine deiminase [Psychrobacter fozii]|uniref:Putative agmatine deiminase n=1 Tax=Psychrobacter fozii TaxID=198480 RepID=A0A2V4UHW3_9GAMM|nr:agmatine deiminase [Psychrobacter fozii]PYE39747.1 agmatine deiminase [Psychrobacter fozii]
MSTLMTGSTPKQDGFYMPAEFAPLQKVWMIWPYRPDNWRQQAVPAKAAYAAVATAIKRFCDVTVLVMPDDFEACRAQLPDNIDVIPMPSNDAWARDIVPTFLINDAGGLRACDWTFNAWGGDYDGLYTPWDDDDKLAERLCERLGIKRYRTDGFVLEGGAFHVDGEGTVLTTRMCLLSPGRNPHLNEQQIEDMLKSHLNVEKVLWVDDGIDPDETTGHIDDIACFARPGEVVCLFTDDTEHPFYEATQKAYQQLSEMTDAKGRKLKVHKLCCTKQYVTLPDNADITQSEDAKSRNTDDICIASYANFLICNGGVIVPQYDDINDSLAIEQLEKIFPEHQVVGVRTKEIVFGGGNIHCITQQQPIANVQ